jgi:hypothetical protein
LEFVGLTKVGSLNGRPYQLKYLRTAVKIAIEKIE